ncbi:MAG TPA: hemolysin family protein [Acidimicrobiales bacterium]|nr:hemolysin family protein [Acidimicrobiales bacterium]
MPEEPSEHELEILDALTALRDTTVREVMTPRLDVVALKAPVRVGDVLRAVRESGHSRFPVYEEDLDHLVGVLFVKDLFRSSAASAGGGPLLDPADVIRRLRKPYLVPEARQVLEVLAEMRQRRNAFAVVVDEYGGVEGIVTIKDLVSELVGELPDEFDHPDESPIVRVDTGRWLVAGDCPVDDVAEELGVELPEGEYVTLGGFLFDRFGHIPEEGETVTYEGWDFRVAEMDRRRVAKVVVRSPSGSIGGAGEPANGK